MGELSLGERPTLVLSIPHTPFRDGIDPFVATKLGQAMGSKASGVIAEIGKIRIVTEGDPKRDQYRCVQYVFATVKKEPWAKEDEEIPIFDNPLEFLQEKGYLPLLQSDTPQNGDIVAYGLSQNQGRRFILKHMGVYNNGLVKSKFNTGDVYEHALETVPYYYGSDVLFFRKQQQLNP